VLIPALTMAEQDRHKGAIDAAREEFLFISINEMIAEFSEYQLADNSADADSAPISDAGAPVNARIICLPANDRADEVTAAMLAQILEQKGFATVSFPSASPSPNEWLASIDAGRNDESASRRCRLTPSRPRGPCANRSANGSINSRWWFASGDSAAMCRRPRLVSSELNPIGCRSASRRQWSMFRNSLGPTPEAASLVA
jgi:hypothetical protein